MDQLFGLLGCDCGASISVANSPYDLDCLDGDVGIGMALAQSKELSFWPYAMAFGGTDSALYLGMSVASMVR